MDTISQKYALLGGANSFLKKPIGREQTCSDGKGQHCTYEGGVIYWHPAIGSYAIQGNILEKWKNLGAEQSHLGYPTSDQLTAGVGNAICGCFQGGRIYQKSNGDIQVTDLRSDEATLTWIAFNAKYLSKNWVDTFKDKIPPPKVLDFSADVNLTRNQSTRGHPGYGCMTYALLSAMDILKDWEHPYTPAVSWHFADWFSDYWGRTHIIDNVPQSPNVSDLANNGIASEAFCQTNWDTEMHYKYNDKGLPIREVWNEPGNAAMEEIASAAPLNRVRMLPNNKFKASKPKDFEHGNLSPSVDEIKVLLRYGGPVWASGGNHAKTIVGFDDNSRQFKILDSYLHDNRDNFTLISYEKVGPSFLFSCYDSDISDQLDKKNIPDLLRQEFSENGIQIPASSTVSILYDDSKQKQLGWIIVSPTPVNQIEVAFYIIRTYQVKEERWILTIYDHVICWDAYAVENFSPVINITNERRATGRHAYSARIRIENNWRGTYNIRIGVDGKEPLVVWTTRGRNRNNFHTVTADGDYDKETPIENNKVLAIDVPLPDYAESCWPPNDHNRWFLQVEDCDRDGNTGQITEFLVARRFIHPDCESVGRYETEIFGGKVSPVQVGDPTNGETVNSIYPAWPPAEPNPNPGITKIYIPPTGFTSPLPSIQKHYKIRIDSSPSRPTIPAIGASIKEALSGQLTVQSAAMPSKPVSGGKLRLMELNKKTYKPWQWIQVAETTTDVNGQFNFEFEFTLEIENVFAVALYGDHEELLASSECARFRTQPQVTHPERVVEVVILPLKAIDLKDPRLKELELLGNPDY